jgi:hypothetical protein
VGASTPATDVWPTPEAIVTVAVDPDETLKPAYRERYFACRLEGADPSGGDPDRSLPLPAGLARVVGVGPARGDFLGGPVLWLAARLQPFPRVLLWPDGEYRDARRFVRPEALADLPRLRAYLGSTEPAGVPIGALVLDLTRPDDAALFWEVAGLVGRSHENFYVGDEAATEVYLLHHHDKVVVSVPDQHARWLLLKELAGLSDVFEDWSGYEEPDADAGE